MPYVCTFAGLKADLLLNADDYSAEYMANLDTIIAESETKVLRDLDLEIFQDEVAAGTLTPANRSFTRPSTLLKINGLWLEVSGSRKFIEKRSKSYCEMYGEDPSITERPNYYAEATESTLFFVNTPDTAYPVIAYGLVRPDGLSDSVPQTWLSLYAGDLLFQVCKAKSEIYLVNPEAATGHLTMYQTDLLPKAKIELRGMSRATYEAAKAASTASQIL